MFGGIQTFFERIPLGCWLLFALGVLGVSAHGFSVSTNLLNHGAITRGVIVNYQTTTCVKSSETKYFFFVQFTDQTGQAHTSTYSQCDYDLNFSPGDSVTIVYLPDDPTTTTITPHDALLADVQVELRTTIVLGLITLILLPLWIRKRIRKAKLQHEHPEAEHSAEQDQYQST